MYSSERYMDMDVLSTILGEFEWPASYGLEDDLPDGILVAFPRCRLYFAEGYEGEVNVGFLSKDAGTNGGLTLADALWVLRLDGVSIPPATAEELRYQTSKASRAKVEHDLRLQCELLLTYLTPCLLGDFSWVERYKAYRATGRIS